MRQHPRPTYGKARGQWPPQLDKGDSSAQFHGQMESARRLSLTVEFSAPLRCVWQRVSLAREIFFMQGMKNGTECTLSRENETLPGAKPDSERNRYDPLRHGETSPPLPPTQKGRPRKRRCKKHRPPVQEVSVVHLHGGTRFPHTESAPAATMSYTMQFSWLAPRGNSIPASFAAYLLMGLPTMADFRPGGSRRFGASLRSQCRPRWVSDPKFLLSCCLTMSRRYNKQPRGVPELDLSSFS